MDYIQNLIEWGLEIIKFGLVFNFFLGLEPRHKKWWTKAAIIGLMGYVVLISYFVENTLLIYLLFITAEMLLLFKHKIIKIVIFSVWTACVIGVCDTISSLTFRLLLGDYVDDWYLNCLTNAITILFIIVVVFMIKKNWSVQKIAISPGYYIFFTMTGFLYSFNVGILELMIEQMGTNAKVVALVYVNALTMYLQMGVVLVLAVAKNGYREKQELSQKLLKVQEEYARYRQDREQDIREFWHDMNSHVIVLQELNQLNDSAGIEKYLENIAGKMHLSENRINVNYNAVNAIIRECMYKAEKKSVKIVVKGKIPENCKVELFDMCSIVANLLNNGIEAAALAKGERKVEFTIRHAEDTLMLHMENPYQGERKKVEGRYQTMKADEKKHGIGLNSIEDSLKKYDGNMKIEEKENRFIIDISIRCLGEK